MALQDGRLAEMATGEGKTLVAVLPVYLNAISGEHECEVAVLASWKALHEQPVFIDSHLRITACWRTSDCIGAYSRLCLCMYT